MTNITITISDDRASRLEEIASRLKVTAEELVRLSIEELLVRPEEEFQKAARYVLEKNTELYHRLS
jgi:antitoxin FitA